ncbi:hypothetical protein Tco_0659464, partial [Tanacetum coccineum]
SRLITVRIPPTRRSLPVRSVKPPMTGAVPPAEVKAEEKKQGRPPQH